MLPVSKFRFEPPSPRYRDGSMPSVKQKWQNAQQDSTGETRDALIKWNEYFSGFQEKEVTTVEGKFTTLVKSASDGVTTDTTFQPLQVRLRKTGSNWNIGISTGSFQGIFGSQTPIMMPAEEVMDTAPVYWFSENLSGRDETDNRRIWAKFRINDSNVYELKTHGVELHLRGTDPDPIYLLSQYQWLHIATIFADGEGGMTAIPEVKGSLWVHRSGGPGSGLVFTPL